MSAHQPLWRVVRPLREGATAGSGAFASYGEQRYSDDEYVLMCLHALAAGIGFDHVGASAA